jgi:hypothetical protein
MLCGQRPLNTAALRALMRSKKYGAQVMIAFVGADAPIAIDVAVYTELKDARQRVKQLEAMQGMAE